MNASTLAALLLALSMPARAAERTDFFAEAARQIARVAGKTHVRYVAVRSLTAADDGGTGRIGAGAAGTLVEALIHQGKPLVLHAAPKAELPDAYVSGSYLPLGDRVQLTITMVSASTGQPLYSDWRVVRNAWGDDGPRLGVGAKRLEAAPETAAAARGARDEAAGSCRDWERRADALQRAVLLPKSRYWAKRYWSEKSDKPLAVDPTRLITSKALAEEFQHTLRFWLSRRQVPRLSAAEVRAMVEADLATQSILDACAPRGAVARR